MISNEPRLKEVDWTRQRLLLIGSYRANQFPLWRGIDQGLTELVKLGAGIYHSNIDETPAEIKKIHDFQPTATLIVNTDIPKLAKTHRTFLQIPGPRGLWFNDLRDGPPTFDCFRGYFSTLFMCWSADHLNAQLSRWRDITGSETAYMPQGAPWNEVVDVPEKRRLFFLGDVQSGTTWHGERAAFMGGLGVTVINHKDRTRRMAAEVESGKLYGSARYAVVHSPLAPGYNSIRLYNVLSYGALALCRRFPGADLLFEDKKHLLFFDGVEDAKALCEHYDERPEERKEIMLAGLTRQREKHTVAHRLANMYWSLITGEKAFWGFL